MAVYFNLGLVTRERDAALACAACFRAQRLVFDGIDIALEIFEPNAVPGGWLLGVWPHGMSYGSHGQSATGGTHGRRREHRKPPGRKQPPREANCHRRRTRDSLAAQTIPAPG
jgi:hypothetical protein